MRMEIELIKEREKELDSEKTKLEHAQKMYAEVQAELRKRQEHEEALRKRVTKLKNPVLEAGVRIQDKFSGIVRKTPPVSSASSTPIYQHTHHHNLNSLGQPPSHFADLDSSDPPTDDPDSDEDIEMKKIVQIPGEDLLEPSQLLEEEKELE